MNTHEVSKKFGKLNSVKRYIAGALWINIWSNKCLRTRPKVRIFRTVMRLVQTYANEMRPEKNQ